MSLQESNFTAGVGDAQSDERRKMQALQRELEATKRELAEAERLMMDAARIDRGEVKHFMAMLCFIVMLTISLGLRAVFVAGGEEGADGEDSRAQGKPRGGEA